jgi:cytochrome c oxidase cbb3-type subunit II
MRPYTPLEQAGRDIYVREGCYGCHSQMIRTLRDEVERYGHYSLAAESMYDHPFQWGSKRTGPDLARVGGKYSDQWQIDHLANPRALVPESIMPGYPWLADRKLQGGEIAARLKTLRLVGVPYSIMPGYAFLGETTLTPNGIADHLKANRAVGVPYSDEMIANAEKDLAAQVDPDSRGARELSRRYPKAKILQVEGRATPEPTEMDALVAYLQILGQMVDFATFDASGPNLR